MNFQHLHPATELWFSQRQTCERCAHLLPDDLRVMRCSAVEWQRGTNPVTLTKATRATVDFAYCIDARLAGNPCGPVAKLYKQAAARANANERNL